MKRRTLAPCALMALFLAAMGHDSAMAASQTNAPAKSAPKTKSKPAPVLVGSIERLQPAFSQLVATNAVIEQVATGFQWTEGPVWMPGGYLLFSDIPSNSVMKWVEGQGVSVYLHPSGYSGKAPRGGESGSNGLTHDSSGHLVLCQHGNRCVARLEAKGRFTVLAEYYRHQRFNSPNDLVYDEKGNLYFTDPPYGLEKGVDDLRRELPFQGVYRLSPGGEVSLLTTRMSRPNGLAFSPDGKKLYVANSDPTNAVIMVFAVKGDGLLGESRVFFDFGELAKGKKGLPDGLKVDRKGNVFATGPGGVLVISPAGSHLGTIDPGDVVSNCAWGGDGSTLYMTVNHSICRVKTLTKGRI